MIKSGYTRAWVISRGGDRKSEYDLTAVNDFVASVHSDGGVIESVAREVNSQGSLVIIIAYAMP